MIQPLTTTLLQYIIWINKAIEDGLACGMPASYAEKYLRPFCPELSTGVQGPMDNIMIRTTQREDDERKIPRGFASWSRG